MGGVVESIGNAVGTVVGSITGSNAQLKAQKRAQQQAEKRAAQQAELQKQEINRANSKSPDMGSLLDQAQATSKLGAQGTLLTGAGGVNRNDMLLDKNTLLGG
ncbi:MAG: hypothetical protein NC112_09220 [Oxalobacter formigenes]|nr:hypothetical protein [Oxalobacter formigenes]